MSDHDPEPATPPGGASSSATPLQTAAKPQAAAPPGGSRPVRGHGSAGMLVAAAAGPPMQLAQQAYQAQQVHQAQQAHLAQQHAQLARQMQQVQQEQQVQFAQQAQHAQLGMLPRGLLPIDARMPLPAPLVQPLSPRLTTPQQASMAQWAVTQPSSSLSAELLALQDAAWRLSDNPQAAHFAVRHGRGWGLLFPVWLL